jgi:hypothetical protein
MYQDKAARKSRVSAEPPTPPAPGVTSPIGRAAAGLL